MTKTRFAPSPTGYLHVGGARTALFAWLYAKKTNGRFVLRIEDTDRERSTQESIDAILQGMQWLGLDYDEGPFYQTQRMARYQECIEQLLSEGKAYKCYCSKERLDALREQQMADKQKPRYDGKCREAGEQAGDYVIRFRNPTEESVVWQDAVKGRIDIANSELDDFIIARSDGTPTYNFTVVVDDWDMGISHVIRGDDHVNNTPRQINMLHALGATIPEYAHVPMILGEDGKRLSKRHGAVSVMAYREQGFLPQALLNYLVRLGWSSGDQEIFSLEEMQAQFTLDHINNSPAAFSLDKLTWLNEHYLRNTPLSQWQDELIWHYQQIGLTVEPNERLQQIVSALLDRVSTVKQLVEQSRYFFTNFDTFEEKAAKKHLRPVALEPLTILSERFTALDTWDAAALHAAIEQVAAQLDVGMGKVGMPLRVAITGQGMSPGIDITAELLGKATVLARLDQAIAFIKKRQENA